MSLINFNERLTINEVARLIANVGTQRTVRVLSEPGCGKTSILKILAKLFPTHRPVYIDVPNTRDGDLFMRMPNRDTGKLEQYTTDLFDPTDPRPVIAMFDEFDKAPRSLKPLFTRALLERTIGDYKLPEGSMVFATSNNASDGVGDSLSALDGNRVITVQMSKPDVDTWCAWAAGAGITPITLTAVQMNPRCLASYTDGDSQRDNELIFNPVTNSKFFVSPRSLEAQDVVIRQRDVLGDHVTRVAIAGACGSAWASYISNFLKMADQLVNPKTIIADPMGVEFPTKPAVKWMTMFNLRDVIQTQDHMSNAVKYIQRAADRELESVFNKMVLNSDSTAAIAQMNEDIQKWMITNKNYTLLR